MRFSTYPEDVLTAPRFCFSIVAKDVMYTTHDGRQIREYYRPMSELGGNHRILPQVMWLDTIHRIMTWHRHAHGLFINGLDRRVHSDAKWRRFWEKWNVVSYENFPASPLCTVYTSPKAFFQDHPYYTKEVQHDCWLQLGRMQIL